MTTIDISLKFTNLLNYCEEVIVLTLNVNNLNVTHR